MSQARAHVPDHADDHEVPPTPQTRVPRVPQHDIPEVPDDAELTLADDEVVAPPQEPELPPVEDRRRRAGDALDETGVDAHG